MTKILLVEDDLDLSDWLLKGLRQEGYTVDHFANGGQALVAAKQSGYDLLVVDRMIPDLDGISLVKALRATCFDRPILFLTALAEPEERAAGFDAGCDDYMVKPFAYVELSARAGLLLARSRGQTRHDTTQLTAKDLTIDLLSRECSRQGQKIRLTSTEFKLLEYFMRNPRRLLTRTMLLEQVWGLNFDPTTSVVETHISRLRAKIDNPFEHKLIETLRGDGYVFEG